MNCDDFAQTGRRACLCLWGVSGLTALFAACWVLAAPATVWAQTYDCNATTTSGQLLTPYDAPPASSIPNCQLEWHGNHASTYSYQVCSTGESAPSTPLPKPLQSEAEQLAADFVETFAEGEGFDTKTLLEPTGEPTQFSAQLEMLADRLEQAGQHKTHLPRACFPGEYDEECQQMPSQGAMAMSGPAPVYCRDAEVELPDPPEIEESCQPPLVRLRVGPSPGYDSPPDRPPPV